ncbi:type II toxin-antitoxin system mRNA interferase toxin, RelE/StbE family [Candidatus Woesearchaeota archaeon]|nr:type II toxin-antitoxin system mRNA interferase toxin, RelE/StbE family [Candidatus Woesearchaeota archaeon]
MYEIYIANNKTEKLLKHYIKERQDIATKLQRLRHSPRTEIGAHPLHGRLAGKWSCWLGSNIRMIYSIDDSNKRIIVEAVGTHKIY